jgi:hypothetical protein
MVQFMQLLIPTEDSELPLLMSTACFNELQEKHGALEI